MEYHIFDNLTLHFDSEHIKEQIKRYIEDGIDACHKDYVTDCKIISIDHQAGILICEYPDKKTRAYQYSNLWYSLLSKYYKDILKETAKKYSTIQEDETARHAFTQYLQTEVAAIIVPNSIIFNQFPKAKNCLRDLVTCYNTMYDCHIPNYFAKMFHNIEVEADIVNNSSHEPSFTFLPIVKQKLQNPQNRSYYENHFKKLHKCCIDYEIIDAIEVPFQTFLEALVYAKTDRQIILLGGAALHGFFLSKIMNIYNKHEFSGAYFSKQTRIISQKLHAPTENTLYEYINRSKSKYAKNKAMNKIFDDIIINLK